MWFGTFLIIVIGSSIAFGIALYLGTPRLARWMRDREKFHIKYTDGTESTMTRKEIMDLPDRPREKKIEFIRDLITQYDEGKCTAGEVSGLLFDRHMKQITEALRTSGRMMTVGSYCGDKAPEPETFLVRFSYASHHTDIVRTDGGQPLLDLEAELKYVRELAVEAGLTCPSCQGSTFGPKWNKCPTCHGYGLAKESK